MHIITLNKSKAAYATQLPVAKNSLRAEARCTDELRADPMRLPTKSTPSGLLE